MRTINATAGAASVATPGFTPQTQSPVAKGSASHKRPPTLKSQGTDLLPDGFNSLTLTSADSMLDQTRYPTPSETLELLAYPRSRPHVSLKRQRERDDDECMEDIEMTGSDPKRPRLTREVSPSEPIFDYHDDINCNETLDDVLAPPNTLRHSTVAAFSAYTPRGQSEPLYPNFQTPDSSRQSHKAFDLTQISFKCEERTSPCPSSPLGKVLTVDYFSNCPTRSMSWLSKLEYVSPRAEERYRLGSYLPNTESASDQFAVYMLKWDTMFEIESRCRPSCEYLNKHHLITEQMRMILCQWLSEVASDSHNKSTRQTYHRSVAYLDFIMSYDSNIGSDEFQYVGAAALYFAAKLEELSYEGHVANLITFEMEFLDDQISEEERLKTHVEAVERMRKYESKLLKIPVSARKNPPILTLIIAF
ncbi:hypothetical protein BC829DRAFT_246821 [Chytridium lagenaria]|nr:hypothetical protein BC829DRAFT_246821 [Chytridium lagenaria]